MRTTCQLRFSLLLSALCLTALLTVPSTALAWGKFGHVTICEIAYRTTTDAAREQINALIQADGKYTSFNRACLFADRFPRTRPAAHYVNYARTLSRIQSGDRPGGSECVLSAIEDDFYKLKDTTLSDAERGEAMVQMGHWVGDIHQPLHVSFCDDQGGNLIKKRGLCSASNLHAVWDNCNVDRRVFLSKRLAQDKGWSHFTRAYRAADQSLITIMYEAQQVQLYNTDTHALELVHGVVVDQ